VHCQYYTRLQAVIVNPVCELVVKLLYQFSFRLLLVAFCAVPLGPLSFGIFTAICILCLPVALVKSLISLIQLYAACQNVVAIDVADRERAAAEASKRE
jgi:uncharacterized membrane protein YccF (DUF307 family)